MSLFNSDPDRPQLPDPPIESGEIGAVVYDHGSGGSRDRPFKGRSLQLRRGVYNFDELSAAGLHDRISSMKVEPGWTVRLYKHVESGTPVIPAVTIEGPAEIGEFRGHPKLDGFENEVSAIEVYRQERSTQPPPGRSPQPTPPPLPEPPLPRGPTPPREPNPPGPSTPPINPNPPAPTNPPAPQPPQPGAPTEAGLGSTQALVISGSIVALAATYLITASNEDE